MVNCKCLFPCCPSHHVCTRSSGPGESRLSAADAPPTQPDGGIAAAWVDDEVYKMGGVKIAPPLMPTASVVLPTGVGQDAAVRVYVRGWWGMGDKCYSVLLSTIFIMSAGDTTIGLRGK